MRFLWNLTWWFYDISMGFLLDSCGDSMVFVWYFALWDYYSISMGCRWYFYGVPMGFQEDVHGSSIGFLWHFHDVSMIFLEGFYGISMVFLRRCFYDISVGFYWIPVGSSIPMMFL